MKYIFVDESYDSGKTESDRYFVLTALKTDSIEVLEMAIRETRKQIKEYNRNHKGKKKKIMLQEIHEHEIHSKYPIVKKWVLEKTFHQTGQKVEIYTVWFDMNQVSFPNEVERYKALAKELLSICGVEDVTYIHFDIFLDDFKREKPTQQRAIKNYLITELGNLGLAIQFKSSQQFSPLQAVDVVAGTIRRNLHRTDPNGYKKIRRFVKGELEYRKK